MKKPQPTPGKVRSAKSKAALLDAGGRRINLNLSPEANTALITVKSAKDFPTDKAAIEDALIHRASRLK